jgi:hypothetical protein
MLYIWSIVVLMMLFGCFVLLPFYANNIHTFFVNLPAGQDLPRDVYTFAPFSWPFGMYLRIISLLLLFLVPVYVVIMSGRSLWILWLKRADMSVQSRVMNLVVLFVSLALLAVTFSDWWRIGYWLAD